VTAVAQRALLIDQVVESGVQVQHPEAFDEALLAGAKSLTTRVGLTSVYMALVALTGEKGVYKTN
jgi:hypothetical protein